jgi:hypothetical protein
LLRALWKFDRAGDVTEILGLVRVNEPSR